MLYFCLARRITSSESTQDLLQSCKSNGRRASLDSNENQSIVSLEIEDHVSAHVNPALASGEYAQGSCLSPKPLFLFAQFLKTALYGNMELSGTRIHN